METNMSFGDIDIPSNGNRDNAKIEELFDVYSASKDGKGAWVSLRFLPTPLIPIKVHWIKIRAGKEKKEVKIPKLCVSFDPLNAKQPRKDKEHKSCPYCDLAHGPQATAQSPIVYYTNAIVRDIQDSEPRKIVKPSKAERKAGFKDVDSDTWTPVRVIRLPLSVVTKLKKLEALNQVKDKATGGKKTKPLTDPKFGRDINIMYDKDVQGTDAYSVQLGEGRSKLTETEAKYMMYDLTDPYAILEAMGLETVKEAKAEFKKLEFVGHLDVEEGDDEDDDDDDDDMDLDDEPKKKKKKSSDKVKKKKKKKKSDDDDDDIPF